MNLLYGANRIEECGLAGSRRRAANVHPSDRSSLYQHDRAPRRALFERVVPHTNSRNVRESLSGRLLAGDDSLRRRREPEDDECDEDEVAAHHGKTSVLAKRFIEVLRL